MDLELRIEHELIIDKLWSMLQLCSKSCDFIDSQPLIIPMVFHMLINGQGTHLKCIQSGDCVDDQSLGRSYDRFPQSCAVKSCGCLRAYWSHVRSCARSCVGFPGSCAQRFSLVAG